ncbi:MAG: Stk1 family PASTA domain-containing Ser/Thr kinase [Clostridiaceae bacterium]|jgi:serine/threonine protein kinase|nr:Stk1 family PASTA domain-containing Ser/Thr kinase [Clostridiaceae bacterium]
MRIEVLGNRYELLEKIGGGGMAVVYKAKCRLLNRFVAVKILRDEFIEDEEFVKRFEVEAQSAASLSHPNIVSIYDVGSQDNIYYIVMEYVEGYTLKEYIASKGTIQWKEAVKIAIQICSAIEHAHNKQIIHRDIKPQNILMTKEGIAKVTDFGIARAATSSTITIAGNTIGSVHYFSPEQARGGYIDEKSDLYSLGIVIYEMITGKMPFDGESPVAVALKHIHEKPVQPKEIKEDIPKALNDLVMKAIKKEQSGRYQTASEMLEDLYRVIKEPNGDFADDSVSMDLNPTKKMRAIDEYENDESPKKEEYNIRANKGKNKVEKSKKGDRISIWLAIIISFIVIGVFTYIGYSVFVTSMPAEGRKFIVKNYVGKDFYEIVDELKNANIEVIEHWIYDEEIVKNYIIKQSVEQGSEFKLDGYNSIEFHISKGPQLVKIPDLTSKECRKAEVDLQQLNLKPKVVDEYSDIIPVDHVISTYPAADEEVKPETEVILYRSLGPQIKTVQVPDLLGRTYTEAQLILDEHNLRVGTLYPEDRSPGSSKIIKQEPESGETVNEETAVNMYFDQTKYVSIPLELKNPELYGEYVKVVAQITTSDTNETRILSERTVQKEYFPISIDDIPVPENGSTKIRILIDDKLYREATINWSEIE